MNAVLELAQAKPSITGEKKRRQAPTGNKPGKPLISEEDKKVSAYVRHRRWWLRLEVPQIAPTVGISRQHWNKLERGAAVIGSGMLYVMAEAIAEASKTSVDHFLSHRKFPKSTRRIPEKMEKQYAVMEKMWSLSAEQLGKVLQLTTELVEIEKEGRVLSESCKQKLFTRILG